MKGELLFVLVVVFSISLSFIFVSAALPFNYSDVNYTNMPNVPWKCFFAAQLEQDSSSCYRPNEGSYATGCKPTGACVVSANPFPYKYSGKSGGLINSDWYGGCDALYPWAIPSTAPQICACYQYYYWNASSACVNNKQNFTCTLYSASSKTTKCNDGCINTTTGADNIPAGTRVSRGCVSTCTQTNGGVEICDSIDNDCDNQVDEGNVCAPATVFVSYWAPLNNTSVVLTDLELNDTILKVVNSSSNLGSVNVSVKKYNSSAMVNIENESLNFGSLKKGSSFFSSSLFNLTIGNKLSFNSSTSAASATSANVTVVSKNNALPVANIISPNNSYNYFKVNTSVNFTQNSTDLDDTLSIYWDFADGTNNSFGEYVYWINSTSANTAHNYTLTGAFNAKLTATEETRSEEDTHSSTDTQLIYILKEGYNLIPIISSPIDGSSVGAGRVDFDISKSFVVQCNSTLTQRDFVTNDSLLGCDYILKPGDQSLLPAHSSKRLFVNWTFGDGQSRVGNWNTTNYNAIVKFPYYYTAPGKHIAKVELKLYG